MASVKQAWIKKYGEEEGLRRWEERKKLSATTEEILIKKYGEIEGLKRWESYKKKLEKRGTKNWFIEKYGEVEGVTKWKEKNSRLSVSKESLIKNGFSESEIETIRDKHREKSIRSLDNFIKQYGESDGLKYYNVYREKNKLTSSWGLEYWIHRCNGNIEEAKNKLNFHQNRNLDWWVSKYGEIDGVKKHGEWVKKITKVIMSGDSISKGQMLLEDEIRVVYGGKILGYKDQYGIILTNDEKRIFKIKNSIIYPDIILKDLKIVINYHGDFWHASPLIFTDENLVVPRINKTVKQIRLIDLEKDKLLTERGYLVITIWENDFKRKKEEIIETIKKTIENENSKKRN